jgi:hypothetical protein
LRDFGGSDRQDLHLKVTLLLQTPLPKLDRILTPHSSHVA